MFETTEFVAICYKVIGNQYSRILAGTNFAFPKGKPNNLLTFFTKSHLLSFQNFIFKGKDKEGRATISSHGMFFHNCIGEYPAARTRSFTDTVPSPC